MRTFKHIRHSKLKQAKSLVSRVNSHQDHLNSSSKRDADVAQKPPADFHQTELQDTVFDDNKTVSRKNFGKKLPINKVKPLTSAEGVKSSNRKQLL